VLSNIFRYKVIMYSALENLCGCVALKFGNGD
jgi:hypothetical protein